MDTATTTSDASRTLALESLPPRVANVRCRDPLARAQASRFANSRASEAEARKLVGGMKKDAKGRFVEPGRKTRPTLAFAFAPQPPPAVEEPEEVDEIEDADEGNEGARILELEVERRRKLESSRMLSRLETMDRELPSLCAEL